MLFKAVKIINSAPLKIPEVSYERFKRIFSKGLDIGFFKDVSDDSTKGALRATKSADPELKEKDGKNMGALFEPEPDKNEQHTVQ
jgi:hypothetical protein